MSTGVVAQLPPVSFVRERLAYTLTPHSKSLPLHRYKLLLKQYRFLLGGDKLPLKHCKCRLSSERSRQGYRNRSRSDPARLQSAQALTAAR